MAGEKIEKMSNETVPHRVAGLVSPVAEAHGLELIDVEFAPAGGRSVLRLILDREGGISVDDLARVSREVGDLLDANDTVPSGYTLECSSPGVNRPLKKPADFARFCGETVSLRTKEEIAGGRNFSGVLLAASEDDVEIEDRSRGRLSVPYGLIEKARYEHDFARDLRRERN